MLTKLKMILNILIGKPVMYKMDIKLKNNTMIIFSKKNVIVDNNFR